MCSTISLELSDSKTFELVINVLEQRLPKSCNVYNMIKAYPKWAERNKVFWLKLPEEIEFITTELSWIVVSTYREDRGADINISAPQNLDPIRPEIFKAFSNSDFINWNSNYLFPVTERPVTKMLMEISIFEKGNSTNICPCYIYVGDQVQCANYDITSETETNIEGLKIVPLDVNEGSRFILNEWKFAIPKTDEYLSHILVKNDSMGVWLKEELICGVATHINGTIGMLNTKKSYRGKGFGQMCMKRLLKNIAMKGQIPCSAAEMNNEPSIKFHEKIGMTFSHFADYVSSQGKS